MPRYHKKTEFEYMKNIQENLGHFTGDDGGISTHGLWKAKNHLFPKNKDSNPVALKDREGNLITNPEGIKVLRANEMIERLRHRNIHPNLLELQHMKEKTMLQKNQYGETIEKPAMENKSIGRCFKIIKEQ